MKLQKIFSNQRFKYGGTSIILVVLVLAILILINLLVSNLNLHYDLTADKRFSINPQTVEILQGLDVEIQIRVFTQKGSDFEKRISEIFKEYKSYTTKLDIEFIDPDKEPSRARKDAIDDYDTILVMQGDRIVRIYSWEIYDYYNMEFVGEQALTRGIWSLVRENEHTAYFITGHEELSIREDIYNYASDLVGEGFEVKTLNILAAGKVPEDASILIMAGPKHDLLELEVSILNEYLNQGGNLMVLVDPEVRGERLDNLKGLLVSHGFLLHDNLVIDPERHFFYDALTLIPHIYRHPITDKLVDYERAVIVPFVRSMELVSTDGRRSGSLLVSSNKAWGEVDFVTPNPKFDRGIDYEGPLTLAGVVQNEVQRKDSESLISSRIVVIGSSSLLLPESYNAQGNRDFVINTVQWSIGEEEQLTIRAKAFEIREMVMNERTAKIFFYTVVLIIPIGFMSIGFGVWLRRRSL